MAILFRTVLPLLLIGAMHSTQAMTLSDVDTDATAGPVPAPAVALVVTPIAPQQMLENIKQALEHGDYLSSDFFTLENLKVVFGEPYTFKTVLVPKELSIRVISLDSVLPAGENQPKVTETPLFNNGKIYLTDLNSKQIIAHLALMTNVATAKPDLINAELVQKVFGKPTSITSAKTDETPDTTATNERLPVSPMGNVWLNYQTESGDVFKNALFKTDATGLVTEVQIYSGKKQ